MKLYISEVIFKNSLLFDGCYSDTFPIWYCKVHFLNDNFVLSHLFQALQPMVQQDINPADYVRYE